MLNQLINNLKLSGFFGIALLISSIGVLSLDISFFLKIALLFINIFSLAIVIKLIKNLRELDIQEVQKLDKRDIIIEEFRKMVNELCIYKFDSIKVEYLPYDSVILFLRSGTTEFIITKFFYDKQALLGLHLFTIIENKQIIYHERNNLKEIKEKIKGQKNG